MEVFLFEPLRGLVYTFLCTYWLQTLHIVRYGGGLVTADKSGAFFVLNRQHYKEHYYVYGTRIQRCPV